MKKDTIELIRMILTWTGLVIGIIIMLNIDDIANVMMLNLTLGIPTLFYLTFVVYKKRDPAIILSLLLGISYFIFMILDVIFITVTGNWKVVMKGEDNE